MNKYSILLEISGILSLIFYFGNKFYCLNKKIALEKFIGADIYGIKCTMRSNNLLF